MQYEAKSCLVLKAISWRTWAMMTTVIIVFIFTGEFALAMLKVARLDSLDVRLLFPEPGFKPEEVS